MKRAFLFISVLFITHSGTLGQTTSDCETIYDVVEVPPEYQSGFPDLAQYVAKNLNPIISNCKKRDGIVVTRLDANLTIDKKGKVIDVVFQMPELTTSCKEELKKKLLAMTGWTPGQLNDQPVCSRFPFLIGCIKWE